MQYPFDIRCNMCTTSICNKLTGKIALKYTIIFLLTIQFIIIQILLLLFAINKWSDCLDESSNLPISTYILFTYLYVIIYNLLIVPALKYDEGIYFNFVNKSEDAIKNTCWLLSYFILQTLTNITSFIIINLICKMPNNIKEVMFYSLICSFVTYIILLSIMYYIIKIIVNKYSQ